ncbi:MAG: hypothetical protein ABF665_15685, partial [Gluconacetobacter sp.]
GAAAAAGRRGAAPPRGAGARGPARAQGGQQDRAPPLPGRPRCGMISIHETAPYGHFHAQR